MSLREEIFEQPAVLQRWLRTQLPVAQEIGRALQQREIDFVFLAARGTSDHAGVYAQYLWGAENKLPVAFAAPSHFTRYGEWPRLKRSLVVGISQSGQSPDVVSVITEGRKQGAATLAITNAIDSPLAQSAEFARAPRVRVLGPRAMRAVGLVAPMVRELSGTAYQFTAPFVVDDSATVSHVGWGPEDWDDTVRRVVEAARTTVGAGAR